MLKDGLKTVNGREKMGIPGILPRFMFRILPFDHQKESMANAQASGQNQPQQGTTATTNKVNEPLGNNGPEEEDDLPF